jgi:hypothetical protein
VARIRRRASDLLGQRARFPVGSRSLHLVERTLAEYLPATLSTYQSLAPAAAAGTPLPDGRTGQRVLQDELDILEARLDEVANELWLADVGRLLANERFLRDHVGSGPMGELTIPRSPGPTAAERADHR